MENKNEKFYYITQEKLEELEDNLKFICSIKDNIEFLSKKEMDDISIGFELGKIHKSISDKYIDLFETFSDIRDQTNDNDDKE